MIQYFAGYGIIEEQAVLSFLTSVNESFTPPLSNRVELTKYANKIFSSAYVVIASNNEEIIGFCAFYENNVIERKAFLTLIYTDPGYQKKGIASALINKMIDVLKKKSFSEISLEVASTNTAAVHLYKNFGFEIEQANGIDLWMKKVL